MLTRFAAASRRRWWALPAVLVLAGVLFPAVTQAVSGNIAPSAIEVDAPNTANLFPGGSSANCPVTSGTDWVKDCNANTDTPALVNSIATGITPNVTGKVGGTGHWNGARIVDGFASADQDIFLTGGKEDDVSTWNVGPGTVGSSKYDMTQAYLANNTTDLFFGMERRGNNGTTAFDFEFNQAAPAGGAGTYVPKRTVNDVLLTFEMQGSGGSGSAVAHFFKWSGSAYVEKPLPAGVVASINDSDTTPAAPWGHVNGTSWTGGALNRFEFAEAKVPLSVLPNVSSCGGKAFVEVRTRSSSTSTSDLKDTSKIFDYEFGSPSAAETLGTNCLQQFTYDGSGSTGSTGSTSGLVYSWDITVSPTTATLSGGGVSSTSTAGKYTSTSQSGTVDVNLPTGVNSATVSVKNTIGDLGCTDTSGSKTVTVYRLLGAVATLTPQCNNNFGYSATASGGNGPYAYSWKFQKNSLADGTGTWSDVGTSGLQSGTFNAGAQGAYRGVLTVTDTAATSSDSAVTPKPQCSKTVNSNTINVYNAVGAGITLIPDCDQTFGYTSAGSGGKAPYHYAVTVEKNVSGTWTTAATFSADDTIASPGISGTLDVDSFATGAKGDGTYRARVTITDSQGIVCTANATSNSIDVLHALTVSASKTSADGSTLTANLTGVTAGTSYQWQKLSGGTWVDIPSATAITLGYSSFAADSTPSATTFSVGSGAASGNYAGQLYSVSLRLHASRVVNSNTCDAFSPAVVVKKVVGVDP